MKELFNINQTIFGARTSFFYHRPLREQLPMLCVTFYCIFITSCCNAVWDSTWNGMLQTEMILQDKIAVVGKVFLYHIPRQVEESNFTMQVTEGGSTSLPDWLKFNMEDSTLYGIATVLDIGYHYISATLTSMSSQLSINHFNDVFTIDVVLDSPAAKDTLIEQPSNGLLYSIKSSIPLTYEKRVLTCIPEQPQFTASIIIDTTFPKLNGQARVNIVLKFAEFLFRNPFDITLSSHKSTSISRLLKKSIVAAGIGNVEKKPTEENLEITWTVACNHQFRVAEFTRIMEHNILSGTLVDVIGHFVLGWYITRDEPKIKPMRFRRQANGAVKGTPVQTPSLSMVTPTNVQSTVSFSFPSTSFSMVSIEPTLSTLIQTVAITSTLDFISLSPTSGIVMTSPPATLTGSLDGISDILTLTSQSPTASTSLIRSTSAVSSELVSSEITISSISFQFPTSIIKETKIFLTSSPSLTFSFPFETTSLVTSEAIKSSTIVEYSSVKSSIYPYISTATVSSSFVPPFSTELSTSSLFVVSTVSHLPPLSSLVVTSLSSRVSAQLLTSSQDLYFSTPVLSTIGLSSSFMTSSSLEISSVSSEIIHTPSSAKVPLSSSSFITTSFLKSFSGVSSEVIQTSFSTFFMSSRSLMATSSIEYLATTSLVEESSIIPSIFTSSIVDGLLTSLPPFITPSLAITPHFSSTATSSYLFPTESVSTTSEQIQMSSTSLFEFGISSTLFGSLSVQPSSLLPTMSSVYTPSQSFKMSSDLSPVPSVITPSEQTQMSSDLSPVPSVITPSEQTQMSSSLFEFYTSSTSVYSPSFFMSLIDTDVFLTPSKSLPTSTLLPTISSVNQSSTLLPSTFITPTPSLFVESAVQSTSIIVTMVPSMAPTPALSTSFMEPLSSISVTSFQVVSSDIMPTPPSFSSTSVIVPSRLPVVTPEPVNERPVVLNPINHITITIGRILEFSIPSDTFYDAEDGNTRNLQIELLTRDNEPLEGYSWVRLNAQNQVIYGLSVDAALISQKVVYNLFATDSNGYSVFDALYIELLPDPFTYSHEFLITFSNNFLDFTSDVNNAINVCKRIAKYYGDPNTAMITVASITEGSVIYGYSNNSISKNICNKHAINREYSRLAYANGSLNVGLTIAMQPKFSVIAINKELKGVCLPELQTTESTNAIAEKQSSEGVLPIIIPILVCAFLLLLCSLCVCCCYKRKRHGEEFLLQEERNMYVCNRKPIFLDNELYPTSTKAAEPVVLPKDISPFLPSPISANMPLEGRPLPPSYLNEGYKKDDPDGEIPMSPLFMPPAYSPQPLFNRPPPSYLNPPAYRLPPAYESEDVGIFETSKI